MARGYVHLSLLCCFCTILPALSANSFRTPEVIRIERPVASLNCTGPLQCSFANMAWGHMKYAHPLKADHEGRRLQNEPPAPPSYTPFKRLRMHIDTSNLESALSDSSSASLLKYIRDDLFPAAKWHIERFLRVNRIQGTLLVPRQCPGLWKTPEGYKCRELAARWNYCGPKIIPDAHFEETEVCRNTPYECETMAAGKGLSDTDFVLYVTHSATAGCSSETVGYGANCVRDQFDRPVAGFMHICPNQIKGHLTRDEFAWRGEVGFIIHEIFHSMGWSGSDVAFFRDEVGNPRSSRKPSDGQPYASPYSTLIHASDPTSMEIDDSGTITRARLITPRVRKVAQEFYGCPSLTGVLLENQGATGSQFQHWERRSLGFEVMSPVTTKYPVLSDFTAAFFEDSGWYRADKSETGKMLWGRAGLVGNGCDFVDEACLTTDNVDEIGKTTSDSPFCVRTQGSMCTHDHRAKANCGIEKVFVEGGLPEEFSYFTDSTLAGATSFMDFCPVKEAYSNGHCEDENATDGQSAKNIETQGEYFGADSSCFLGSMLKVAWRKDGYNPLLMTGQCFKRTCLQTGTDHLGDGVYNAVSIAVIGDEGDVTIRCDAGDTGVRKEVEGFQGVIECPDVKVVCWGAPCRNGGVRKNNKCVCALGFIGALCENRSSAAIRQDTLNDFSYEDPDVTLWLGRFYSLPATGHGPSTRKFEVVTPLPSGLSLDATTGTISGIPLAVTYACYPYTIKMVGSTNGQYIGEARAVINIHVTDQSSELPTTAFDACATYTTGTAPSGAAVSEDALTRTKPAPRPGPLEDAPSYTPTVRVTSFSPEKINLAVLEAEFAKEVEAEEVPEDGAHIATTAIAAMAFMLISFHIFIL